MRIEITKGKYGKSDKILLFTSTDNNNVPIEREPVSIFKLGLLVNQLAYNELQIKNGYKKRLVKNGKPLFFEEAIKEAIEMAKSDVNWAESHSWGLVKEWAMRWKIDPENIGSELRRTFQKGLDEFGQDKKMTS